MPSDGDPEPKKYSDLLEMIHYSDKYADDDYEYRHVILPKPMLKLIPKDYFGSDGVLKILTEQQWRGLGIQQSVGWENYETHAPEPHIMLFRREKDYLEKYGPYGKGSKESLQHQAAYAAKQAQSKAHARVVDVEMNMRK